MKITALSLILLCNCCFASVEERAPEVEVCLHFNGETNALDQDSSKRLDTFAKFYFGGLKGSKIAGTIHASIYGPANPISDQVAASRLLKYLPPA